MSTTENEMRVCNQKSENKLNANAQHLGAGGNQRTKSQEVVQISTTIFERFAGNLPEHF